MFAPTSQSAVGTPEGRLFLQQRVALVGKVLTTVIGLGYVFTVTMGEPRTNPSTSASPPWFSVPSWWADHGDGPRPSRRLATADASSRTLAIDLAKGRAAR